VRISKYSLDFGLKGQKFPVFQYIYDQFVVQCNEEKIPFELQNIEDPYLPFMLHFNPCSGTLRKEPTTIFVRLYVRRTTRQRRLFPMKLDGSLKTQIFLALKFDSKLVEELDFAEIQFEEKIGEGSYGRVHKGKWRGLSVAIKGFHFKEDFEKERNIFNLLPPHPNIVSYIGCVSSPPPPHLPCILTEFISGRSLDYYLKDDKPLPFELCLKIAIDICTGMNFLHDNNFLHLDLKPQNFLVVSLNPSSPVCVKLADFGVSRALDTNVTFQATAFQGSPLYQAPEIIRDQMYSQKGDVYSFGVCLLEMCTGKKPFAEYSNLGQWDFFDMRRRGTKPGDIPSDSPFSDLLERCLKNDHTQRPTFAELLEMLHSIKNQKEK